MRVGLVVVLLLLGCYSNAVHGRREVVTWQVNLMPIAAFQLGCPSEQLTVVDLGREEKAGVTGCGEKATYVYDGQRGWSRADTIGVVVDEK